MMPDKYLAAACSGKRSMSHDEARSAEKAHKKRARKGAVAYLCRNCGAWHIGNIRGRKRPRKLRAVR